MILRLETKVGEIEIQRTTQVTIIPAQPGFNVVEPVRQFDSDISNVSSIVNIQRRIQRHTDKPDSLITSPVVDIQRRPVIAWCVFTDTETEHCDIVFR